MTNGTTHEAPTDHGPPPLPTTTAPAPSAAGVPTSSEKTYAMLTHLSAFLSVVVVGLFFLGPLVMWLVKRSESPFADHHGKEAVNFHLTMLLAHVGMLVLAIVTCGIAALLWPLLGLWHVIWPVVAAVSASDGTAYRYPGTLRFIS